jgi:hypothetical protein
VQSLPNLAVPAITFLILLAVGLDLTAADFARLRQQHRIVAAGYLRAVGFGGIAALIVLIVASDPVGFANGLASTVPLAATFVATFVSRWLVRWWRDG